MAATDRCRACVLFCIDYRFRGALDRFLTSFDTFGEGADVVRVAGSVLTLVRPSQERDRDYLMRQLVLSVRLHAVREIYLVNHEDCGAYGAEGMPEHRSELAHHTDALRAAREHVAAALPGVAVHAYFLRLDGSFQRVG